MTVPCPSCGRDVYEDADRCPSCGDYIVPGRLRPRRPAWWWIAFALILAVLIGSWALKLF
jgi:endogenous inhibitor of DNA gyrase (YacG/DUF329 family)